MAADTDKICKKERRDYGPWRSFPSSLCSDLGEFGDSTSLPTVEVEEDQVYKFIIKRSFTS